MNLQGAIAEFDVRLRQGMARLAASPFLLIAALLLLDALLHPYRGITHDSRLYAFSVANQLGDGALAGDLYLRFGSQGERTILTSVATSLASLFGLDWSFFLLYLVARVLLVAGILKFMDLFLIPPGIRLAALAMIVTSRMPFGGFELLAIDEPFLTPRPFAMSLSLFAMESALAQRRCILRSALFFICAFLVHPLIPSGPLLAVLLVLLCRERSGLLAPIAAGLVLLGAAGVGILAGVRVVSIDKLDAAWRSVVLARSPFYFPGEWPLVDWLRLGFASLCLYGAAGCASRLNRLQIHAVIVASFTGLLLAIAGEHLPPALLVQAQPYLSLWLLSLLMIPCALWLVDHSIRTRKVSFTGLLLPLALLASDSALCSGLAMLIIFAPFVLWSRRAQDWSGLVPILLRMLFLGFTLFACLTVIFEVGGSSELPGEILRQFKLSLFALVLLPMLIATIGSGRNIRRDLSLLVVLIFAIQSLGFLAATNSTYPVSKRKRAELVQKIRAELPGLKVDSSPLSLYWPGMLDEVWFRLEQLSYFDAFQCAGVVFSRHTAIEAARRSELVAPFERYYYHAYRERRYGGSFNSIPRMALGMYPRSSSTDRPGSGEIRRLCSDVALDLLVLDYLPVELERYARRVSADLNVIDCRGIRNGE
jgi:hypothetical protein